MTGTGAALGRGSYHNERSVKYDEGYETGKGNPGSAD